MLEIVIDGVIGTGKDEISSTDVRAMLPADQTEPIHVKIHSEGGSVFEGFRIFDLFNAYKGPKKVTIESSAFSIASFIPMAFEEVEITPNGYLMIHNPYMQAQGDDEDLISEASKLTKLKANMISAYAAKSKQPEDAITQMLKGETYLNAEEAVALGFCNRITTKPIVGRVFARLDNVPHGVVSALFGAGSDGNQEPLPKEKPMSDSTLGAATIEEIESAFPKMKPATILACLKKQMPMASVATAAVEELMAENQELVARIQAMEEEMAASNAMEVEIEPEEETVEAMDEEMAMEEEETKPVAKVKTGVKPVAKARVASSPSAKAKFESEVRAKIQSGMDRHKALVAVDREYPGLRARMIQEVNQR